MDLGEAPARQTAIRFGDFELDLFRQTFSRRGIRLKLQKQPLQVLVLLIQNAPEVVSRDQIRCRIWGENADIDVEQNINFCIRQIRSVLGDASISPRFVETLPRQGYRWIARIEGGLKGNDVQEDPAVQKPPRATPQRRWLMIASIAATAGAAFFAGVWAWSAKPNEVSAVAGILPITSYPGEEREPSLSPDGRQVAFSWNGDAAGNRRIYTVFLGEQHPVRLTQETADDGYPAWSPDGKHIAFIRRRADSEADIVLIPAIGGPERTLLRIQLNWFIGRSGRIMAWSPDGKWLCFTGKGNIGGKQQLFLLSPISGETRALFPTPASGMGDGSPAFSPNGRWLAFARFTHPYNSQLLLLKLSRSLEPEGTPLLVRDAGVNPRLPVWMPDSKKLVFLDGSKTIMQAGIEAKARQVYAASAELEGLTMAATGAKLAASRHGDDLDIWTIPLQAGGLTAAGNPERIAYSTAAELQPHFSPDGRRLSFVSYRTGAGEVWLAAADGTDARQLTHLAAYIAGYPSWSPDGKFIAFHARFADEAEIYVTRIEDGVTRQITRGVPDCFAPSWSMDGQSLYFGMHQNARMHLCRVSAQGGPPERLLDVDSQFQTEAPGRKLLLYCKFNQPGVYARSLAGNPDKNPEQLLFRDYSPPAGGFYPVSDGVYYSGFTPAGVPRAFRFYSFASGKSVDVAPAPRNLNIGLTVTPDRRHLAYSLEAAGSEYLVQINLK